MPLVNYYCQSQPFASVQLKSKLEPRIYNYLEFQTTELLQVGTIPSAKEECCCLRWGVLAGQSQAWSQLRGTYFHPSRSSPSGTGRCAGWRACGSYGGHPHHSPVGCSVARQWQHPGRRQPSLRWGPAAHSGSAAGGQKARAESFRLPSCLGKSQCLQL